MSKTPGAVESERKSLTSQLAEINSKASIHRERLVRKSELLASCSREVADAQRRLLDAERRQKTMIGDITDAPRLLDDLEAEAEKIKQRLASLNNEALIAKATDMAQQILKLRAMGFTVTPPMG